MTIDHKEPITITVPYGKVNQFGYAVNKFVREFDDVDEIDAVMFVKQQLMNEVEKIQGTSELKDLQEQKAELERKIQRVTSNA